jgi:hypothetical protein
LFRPEPYAQWKFRGWHRHAARFRGQVCPGLVSARTGTAYAGIRPAATTYLRGATALAEGMRSRATGRLLSVAKDPVHPWFPVWGAHCQHVLRYFLRHLHGLECPLDELWPFMAKQEARLTPLEKLAAIAGDAWVWIAFSPVAKLGLAWGVGQRTLCAARQLVAQLQSATDGHLPCFTSPDYLGHQLTLAFAYSHFVVPHRSLRQRLPHSRPTKGRNGSRKKWKPVTPAMAAGLTDHGWTMDELLSLRVPPKHLWC